MRKAFSRLLTVPWGHRAAFERDVTTLLPDAPRAAPAVGENDLTRLPPAVRSYMRFAGVVGRPRVGRYRVRFRGALRNGPTSPWMPIVAEQRSSVDPPARLFLAEGSMYGVPFSAYHRFAGSDATFRVRAASLVTLVDAGGPEMNRSETVTLLNDMCLLAPASLLDERLSWEEVGPREVRVAFTNEGNTVSAALAFDGSGALVDFVSEDRSRTTDGKTYERLRWSTPVLGWNVVRGIRLPASAEAVWGSPPSAFAYARFEILAVAYEPPDARPPESRAPADHAPEGGSPEERSPESP